MKIRVENKQIKLESSSNKQLNIPTDIFNMRPFSEELYEIGDDIDLKVLSARDEVCEQFGVSIDLDDQVLIADPKIRPDRTIIYKCQVYEFDKKTHKHLPLKNKVMTAFEKALINSLVLPQADEKYEYELTVEVEDTQLIIKLRRIQKLY